MTAPVCFDLSTVETRGHGNHAVGRDPATNDEGTPPSGDQIRQGLKDDEHCFSEDSEAMASGDFLLIPIP